MQLFGNISGGSNESSGSTENNPEWISLKPHLVHNWVEYQVNDKPPRYPIGYKKVGNIIYMRGLVRGGDNRDIFKGIPKEIRPKQNVYLPTAGHGLHNVETKAEGFVILHNGFIQARTYSKEWTSIECSYRID